MRPSGAAASGDDVVDLSNFRAERMVIVKRPESGMWTLRLSGSGVSGCRCAGAQHDRDRRRSIRVGSKHELHGVSDSGRGECREDPHPRPRPGDPASIVSGVFLPLAPLPLEHDETDGSYLSRFTPGSEGVRVLIVGKDYDGVVFQRMYAPLITPMR